MVQISGLYAIIDPSRCSNASGSGLETIARAVLRGGASVIQLRDKSSSGRQRFSRAQLLRSICRDFEASFIVNDRLDIALAVGADGVHLGPEDVPVRSARAAVPHDFVIGASAGTPEVANRLENQGADYLGVGAIYEARPSKGDASPPRGPEALGAVVDAVDIPVIGIGGINAENAPQVIAHGACGVAVIRSLLGADDPERAARQLVDAIR